MQGSQRTDKKHVKAASTAFVNTRVFFNSKIDKQFQNSLKFGKKGRSRSVKVSEPSSKCIKVYPRVFVNSDIKMKTCKVLKNKVSHKKVPENGTGVIPQAKTTYQWEGIACSNRFSPLINITEQENNDIKVQSAQSSTRKGKQINEGKQGHKVNLKCKNIDNKSQKSNVKEVSEVISDMHVQVPQDGGTGNMRGESVDVTRTASIVRAVKNGRSCMHKVRVTNIKDKCLDLKKAISQQSTPLGFLLISNLKRFNIASSLKPNRIITEHQFDPVKVHQQVAKSQNYNFMSTKLQLPSKINFELLEELCQDYWDYQLPYMLKYGFPLDFPHEKATGLGEMQGNHQSAEKYPEHVKTYFHNEKQHGAIFGPYSEPPSGTNTHTSPFMSREKPDSDNRRIIIDLSWPIGASVNKFIAKEVYLGTVYKLQYPTIDNITDSLLKLGSSAVIYKVDLSRAFRQLRIDPIDYNLLCLQWEGSYYADTFCPFGYGGGSMMCTRVSDFFRFLMRKRHYTVYNYVDDVIG